MGIGYKLKSHLKACMRDVYIHAGNKQLNKLGI